MYDRNELMHHGVKGQKWGVRRMEKFNRLEKAHNARAKELGPGLRSRYHVARAEMNAAKAERRRQSMNTTGALKKARLWAGSGRDAIFNEHTSKASSRNANNYKHMKNLGKHLSNVDAYNYKHLAKANKAIYNSKNVSSYIKNNLKATYARPMKTMVGRKTTTGREYALNMITSGYGNLALDAIHMTKRR